jgi:hypothetical protein
MFQRLLRRACIPYVYTHDHGIGRYAMRGDYPSGLQVGAVILERVPDNRRRAQVRSGRLPRDCDGIFGYVHDGWH